MTYNSMLTFVETALFTRLIDEYLSDDEYAALQRHSLRIPRLGTSSPAPVVFGSCVGVSPVEANAVEFA